MNSSSMQTLVLKYFGGHCTTEESIIVKQWLQEPGNELLMQQWLWEDWQQTTGQIPYEVSARVRTRISEQTGPEIPQSPAIHIHRIYYGVAAAVILVICISVALFLNLIKDTRQTAAQVAVFTDTIRNTNNHPSMTVLEDGSTVWLNISSEIYIASGFNKNERRVKVNGEAFFQIKPDHTRPFFAETGNIITKVLGTSFNVEAYPGEHQIRVSLISGGVAISAPQTSYLLKPGQMAVYGKETLELQVTGTATSDPSAWTTGKIVLNRVHLSEAVKRLESLYHTHISYDENMIKGKYIAGEFEKDSLSGVLSSILFVHNLKFSKQKNGEYKIY